MMADNDSNSSTNGSGSENKESESIEKSIPKSHKLLITNTWNSYTDKDEEKKLPSEDEKKAISCRVHKAGELLIFPDTVREGILRTVGPGNLAKKTFCYKLIAGNGKEYFVKIFEDSQASPTKVSKKLFTNAKLKCKLEPYLLLPAYKPMKMPLDCHTYEVVIYPFVKHCNLQDITLKALRQQYINPLYHTTNPMAKPHTTGYKLRLLKKFKDCMNIAIEMKSNGYVDMDISPDNFIITTELNNAADNDNIRWDQITDNRHAKCIKIDHESMIKWAEKFKYVEKPMKHSFKPPEVNAKDEDDGKYKDFDVEKANVYQFGATFVYVLYGQLKDIDSDGNIYWKSLPKGGKGSWENAKWNPKYLDLLWLQKCIDDRPHKRPNYNQLHKYIEHEVNKFKTPNKSTNYIGSHKPVKKNNFNHPRGQGQPQPQYIRNNGQVTIIHHTPQTLQQQQQHAYNIQLKQQRMMQQQQQINQQRLMQQQQQYTQRMYQQQNGMRGMQQRAYNTQQIQLQQQQNKIRLQQQQAMQKQPAMQRQRGLKSRANNFGNGNNQTRQPMQRQRGLINRGNNFNNNGLCIKCKRKQPICICRRG